MPIDRLPIPLQTLYAELVDRAWAGDLAELLAAGGTAYTQEVKGRLYHYWQPPRNADGKRAAIYLGPDSESLRARIQTRRDLAGIRRERIGLVRALSAARLPTPDALTGNILAALAAAGTFRLRAVLVGSAAFQCYLPMLGVRLPNALMRTGDLDIAQFHSVSVGVDDEIDADLLTVLRRVDPRFTAVLSPTDTRKILRYAIQVGGQELFSVDVLCPLRGPLRGEVTALKALRGSAQILKHLDFLLFREINAVALHGPGIPVNVPAPERYALHKLLVSQLRIATSRSQAKAAKDLAQADALIRVLAADRRDDLAEAFAELCARGPSWRLKAARAVGQLPEDTGAIMQRLSKQ